jgi:transaldolase
MDWYKRRDGRDFEPEDDPGVQSVRRIYAYFKHFGHATEVMGASFRNIGQVLALAGCDLLTISPELLEQLRADSRTVERRLRADVVAEPAPERLRFDERAFRFAMNEDAMASEKLAEGIRLFVADALRLDALVAARASMALAG